MNSIGQQRIELQSFLFGFLAIAVGLLAGFAAIQFGNPIIIVALIGGPIILVVAFNKPDFGLLILILMIYVRFSDVSIEYLNMPSTAKPYIAFLLLVVILRWLIYKEQPQGWKWPVFISLGYVLVGGLSLFFAANQGITQEALGDFVKDAIVILLVVILLKRKSSLQTAVWGLLAAGIFLGTLSVYQHLTLTYTNPYWGFAQAPLMHIIGQEHAYRIGGPMGSPNAYSQIMIPLIPLAYNRLMAEKKPLLRIVAGYAFIISILTIIFTFSRNGFATMALVIIISLLYKPPKPYVFVVMILLMIPLGRYIPADYLDRVSTLTDLLPGIGDQNAAIQEVSFRGRLSENMAGWLMFRDHPLVGVGLANYPEYYQEYSRQLGIDARNVQRGAHNLYLQIAAEQGLIGLFTFGVIIWSAFYRMGLAKKIFRQHNAQPFADLTTALMIGLTGYLVAGIFIHLAYPRYFWLLYGLALALPQVAHYQEDEPIGVAA